MSGEQQLERSVLESKERDELHAIAEAIGLNPGSRTTKANLVGQILRATGVSESNGEAGGRSEPPEAASENGSRGADAAPGSQAPVTETSVTQAKSAAGETSPDSSAPATDAGGEPPITAQGGDLSPATGTDGARSQQHARQADQKQADQKQGDQEQARPSDQKQGDQQRGERGPRDSRQLDGGGQLEPGNR
ncbi:MAG TPA: hypothetical protein VK988_18430, partial [Acidimicrobiales bacterium]|nr:hypothetical protein [Acidimicrobiales bacterium]